MRCYLFTPACSIAAVAFVAFLGCGTLAAGDEAAKTVVQVDVYYESLCSDSVRWIRDQLTPAYPLFKDHLNVTFVPYGKATHFRENEDSAWQFSCQHGNAECQGNKAQACGIRSIESLESADNHQRLTVELVGCVMSSKYPATAVPQCAQTVGLSTETQNSIDDCLKGSLADELLVANGNKTWALEPSLTFVPTIVIDKVHSADTHSAALRNFSKFICGRLRENEKPTACADDD